MSEYSMIDALADFTRRVDELAIPYMVTGSFAMSAYVPARTTMDIDVVIEIERQDAARFESNFIENYYVSASSIRGAVDNQSMFNVISNSAGVKIDCIVRKSTEFERTKFARRSLANIFGVGFWVISKEDLILSKLRWAKDSLSERQFEDINRLFESGVDDAYLTEWLEREGLRVIFSSYEAWRTRTEKSERYSSGSG
jgi:hypothetical protein